MSEPTIVADIELENLGQDNAPAPPDPVRTRRLRVAVVEKHGSGRRSLLAVQEDGNGGLIMKGLKEMAGAARCKVWLHRLLGRKPAVFMGMVTLANQADLEAQVAPCFVDTKNLEYLPQHTAAYNNPNEFTNWVDFVVDNRIFYEMANGGLGAQVTLVRGWKLDKFSTAVLATVLTLISIIVSVVIGIVWHSAGLGVGVSATVVGLLAFAAFVMVKLFK